MHQMNTVTDQINMDGNNSDASIGFTKQKKEGDQELPNTVQKHMQKLLAVGKDQIRRSHASICLLVPHKKYLSPQYRFTSLVFP